jgi:hypothetical protein
MYHPLLGGLSDDWQPDESPAPLHRVAPE